MSTWTAKMVKDAMVHAFEVLIETTGQVGPDWFKNNWPEYRVEFQDEVGQHQQGTARQQGRVRVQRSAREISRMEMVLLGGKARDGQPVPNWGLHLNHLPAARRALVTWCFWEIFNRHTEVECERRGWAYSTFRRRRDQGAAEIAARLNQQGVDAW